MQKQALTVNEAAEYSGIGRNTLRALIGHSKIPVIQIGNIAPLTLERLFQNLAGKDYSTKTIRDVYNILNSMFKYAIHQRMLLLLWKK